MINTIQRQYASLQELQTERNEFSQRIYKIKESQKTPIHIIISVITLGIFAIIKAIYLAILTGTLQDIDKKIKIGILEHTFEVPANIIIHPTSVEIEKKNSFDRLREMNKGLIRAMEDIAAGSAKKDDVQIIFDNITTILMDIKRGLEGDPAMTGKEVSQKLKEAIALLDKARAKAEEHFEDHGKFQVFHGLCDNLKIALSTETTKFDTQEEPAVKSEPPVKSEPAVKSEMPVKMVAPKIVVSDFLKGIVPQDKLAPVINIIEALIEVVRRTAISVEEIKATDEKTVESVNFVKKILQTMEEGYSQIRQLFQSSTAEESATIFMSLVNKARIFEDLNFEKFDLKIDPTAAIDESLFAIMKIAFNFVQSMGPELEVLGNHVRDLMEGITDEPFKAAVDKEFAKVDTEIFNVIKISEEKLNAIAELLGVLKEIPRDFPTIISTCGMIFDQAIELQSHLKPEMNKDLLIALLKNLNVMMEFAKKMKTMVLEKGDLDPSAPVDPVIYQDIEDGVTKLCDLLQGLLNEEAKTS